MISDLDELYLKLGKMVALSSVILSQLGNYTITREEEKLVPAAIMEGLTLISENINDLAVEAQEILSAEVAKHA